MKTQGIRSNRFFLMGIATQLIPDRPNRKDMHPVMRYTARAMEFQNLFIAMETGTKWMQGIKAGGEKEETTADRIREASRKRLVGCFRRIPMYAFTYENLAFMLAYVAIMYFMGQGELFDSYNPTEQQVGIWGGTSFVVLFLFSMYTGRCLDRYNSFYDHVTEYQGDTRDMLLTLQAHSLKNLEPLQFDLYRYTAMGWILNFTGLSDTYSYEFYDHFVEEYSLLAPEENEKLRIMNDTSCSWIVFLWMAERLRLARDTGDISAEGFDALLEYCLKLRYHSTTLFTMTAWPAPRSFRHSIKMLLTGYVLVTSILVATQFTAMEGWGEPWMIMEAVYYGSLMSVLLIILAVCEAADKPFGEAPQHFPLLVWTENYLEEIRIGFMTTLFSYEDHFAQGAPGLLQARAGQAQFSKRMSQVFAIEAGDIAASDSDGIAALGSAASSSSSGSSSSDHSDSDS